MHRLMAGVTILEHELSELRLLVERQAGILLDCPNSALAAHVAEYLESEQLDSAAALLERLRAAETSCATLDRQATLGRYMLEMRHNLNNALTSVLGNSDLLLLEPGSLSAQTRAQIETIRNMTLRIHEIMQRFSSLEKEMNVVAQQAERDSGKSYAAAAAGD